MKRPNSESALVWNLIYPRAQPGMEMSALFDLKPLWGSHLDDVADTLHPYYWGYDQNGERLPALDHVLDGIDGPGPQTEVDLYMKGERELVLIEAKHLSGLGRCGRYNSGRCPEIHPGTAEGFCRYWEEKGSVFSSILEFGSRPKPDASTPPCNRHYQLGRTLLVGQALAQQLGLRLHLWLILPRKRWGILKRDWIDFSDRVKDDELWKRMRVIAWEDIVAPK